MTFSRSLECPNAPITMRSAPNCSAFLSNAAPAVREYALADAQVTFKDAAGKPVVGKDGKPLTATTDATGTYQLTAPLPAGNLVMEVALGAKGLFHSINVTWDNHEGDGRVAFQQWDGTKWNVISDWIAPDWKLLRPIIEKSSLAYAKEKNIKVRTSIND